MDAVLTSGTAVSFRAFGPVAPVVDGAEIRIGGHRERALLSALLMRPGLHQSTNRLTDLLWGDGPPRDPAHAIRTLVMRLRRHLGELTVETTPGGYRLQAREDQVDLHRFVALVSAAQQLSAGHEFRQADLRFSEALALTVSGEPWVDLGASRCGKAAAAQITELRLRAEEDRAQVRFSMGSPNIGELTKLATEEPLRERRWCFLITALYRSGRQTDALRAYAEVRRTLREEIGVDPGPELVELERQVLAHEQLQ